MADKNQSCENNEKKSFFNENFTKSGIWVRHLIAGGVAGAVSRTCTAPLDRIKMFAQVSKHPTGMFDTMKQMVEEGGIRSLWRGNAMNVLKIAPESAIKFATYEKIKQLMHGDEKSEITSGKCFMAGAAAGGIAQTVIYPMEVLKTRLALRKTGQYKGIYDAAKTIYLREGIRSFYRGYLPNMLGIVPYAGIELSVYQTLKKNYLSSKNSEQKPSVIATVACSSASSTLGLIFTYPLALVKTQLQAQTVATNQTPHTVDTSLKRASSRNNNMLGVFRKIVNTQGFAGLYRGIIPNLIKVLPAVGLQYVVVEHMNLALGVHMT